MNNFTELTTQNAAAPADSSSPSADNLAATSGWLGKTLAAAGAVISFAYLANIGAGFIELGPDNLPGVGNIDEFLFSLLLIFCLQKLGINLLPLLRDTRAARS